jgi:hypothetical protein
MANRLLQANTGLAQIDMADIKENPHSKQTVCELHRRIYRELMRRDPNDPLIPLLQQAFDFTKKIANKLRAYKNDYDDGWYEIHKLDGGDIDEKP